MAMFSLPALPNIKKVVTVSLLLLFGFLFSVVYHLPVSWLLNQPSLQQQIPANIQLSQTKGSLWQGTTHIGLKQRSNRGAQPLGELDWQLSFWSLLMTNLAVETQFVPARGIKAGEGALLARIKLPLLADTPILELSDLQGSLQIAQLLNHMSDPALKNLPVMGEVQLDKIQLQLDLATHWPTELTGALTLNQLELLGNTFPPITVTPELKGNKLLFKVTAKAEGWRLTGHLELLQNHRYTLALKVMVNSPQSMPDWAMMMQQQSPMVAVLNNRGVW